MPDAPGKAFQNRYDMMVNGDHFRAGLLSYILAQTNKACSHKIQLSSIDIRHLWNPTCHTLSWFRGEGDRKPLFVRWMF
jgi:hypothetical protein